MQKTQKYMDFWSSHLNFFSKKIFLKFSKNSWENFQPQRTILKLLSISLKNCFLTGDAELHLALMQFLRWTSLCSRLSDVVNDLCHSELHLRCWSSFRSATAQWYPLLFPASSASILKIYFFHLTKNCKNSIFFFWCSHYIYILWKKNSEKQWLSECPADILPKVFKRYVDDIFAMFPCKSHLKDFVNYMNTRDFMKK